MKNSNDRGFIYLSFIFLSSFFEYCERENEFSAIRYFICIEYNNRSKTQQEIF